MISKQDCFDKLEEISELKENWNGYGAKPIDKDLINECWYIVNQLFVPKYSLLPIIQSNWSMILMRHISKLKYSLINTSSFVRLIKNV